MFYQTRAEMQTPTPASADACTRKPSRLTGALVSPEVAKLLHKLQGQIIKEASAHEPAPGEVVLNAPGKISVSFFSVDSTEVMEIRGEHGLKTNLYRDYQTPADARLAFRPGTWWGSENRIDAAGNNWSRTLGLLVCNDFGDLVKAAA
jgi:hypothetical protein